MSIEQNRLISNRLEGLQAFGAVWLSQAISIFGSELTGFVLGVWVYQSTKSSTNFSLIFFFSVVPEIVMAPLAGAIVDRWDRRRVMLLGTVGAGLCVAALSLLSLTGSLQLWEIYVITAVNSAFQSVQLIALAASTALLVPKRHLNRANGVVELGASISMVIAPSIAGFFLDSIGLTNVLLISAAASLIGVVSLMTVRIPRPENGAETEKERSTLLFEAVQGWRYVKGRPELMALLLLFAITNFTIGIVQALLPPLVLSFATPEVLGIVLSVGGVGVVLGSLLVSIWGGPKRKVRAILGLSFSRGMILFLAALQPHAILIGTAAFLFLFCSPIVLTCSLTIWQTKVANEIQGRALAIRRIVSWSSLPVAYLVAGPLADRVFERLMTPQGPLAQSVGTVIGTGPGRGVALLFIVLGALTALAVTAGSRYRPLRELEDRLPNVAGRD
jgi:MFS family permease